MQAPSWKHAPRRRTVSVATAAVLALITLPLSNLTLQRADMQRHRSCRCETLSQRVNVDNVVLRVMYVLEAIMCADSDHKPCMYFAAELEHCSVDVCDIVAIDEAV